MLQIAHHIYKLSNLHLLYRDMRLLSFLFLFFCLFSNGHALNEKQIVLLDSLNASYQQSTDDCKKASILMECVEIVYAFNRDSVLELCSLAIDLVKDSKDSLCLKTLGTVYNNIGVVNDDNGQIMNAIKAYEASILIFEETGDIQGIAISYTNIGYIYKSLHELDKCLEFNKKALSYRKKIGEERAISNSLNNIGYVYRNLNQLDSAIYYYRKSYALRKLINNERGMAFSLNNIGAVYDEMGDLDSSLYYFKKSLKLHRKTNTALSNTMVNIGEAYYKKGNINQAKSYADSAMDLAMESTRPERIKMASKLSYMVYEKLNDWDQAYQFQKLHFQMVDSIESQKLHDELVLEEAKFRYIRDHIRDSIQFVQKQLAIQERHQLEIDAEKRIEFYELIGIVVLLIIIGLLVIGYRTKKSAELSLNVKNEELFEQNYQITNSINYAKKIQKAVLEYDVATIDKEYEHFIFYRPKEIVSGDFYWFFQEKGSTYVAVGDCSGHGVPAGFLSMLGISFLNEIATGDTEKSPSAILNALSKKFVHVLKQKEEMRNSFDGMDIVLIKLDKDGSQIEWAGANRALIHVSNGEVSVLKPPNVGSIGFFQGENRFVNNTLDITSGDMLYLTSDGYTDQFGGKMLKKFGYPSFTKILSEIHKEDLNRQKVRLMDAFEAWKGEEEQLDDICILGIRV